MENVMNLRTLPSFTKEQFRILIEEKVYDKKMMKEMNIPDQFDNWWIFNFKSIFFEKETARMVADLFWNEIQTFVSSDKPMAIGGMESGAIPFISALCLYAPENISVTGFFVRKSRKKSDLANNIEGVIPEHSQIIIVDDILNRGNSYEKIKKILESNGQKITCYFSLIRYRDLSFYEKKTFGAPLVSLYELNDFKKTLNLQNLQAKSYQPVFAYENKWALQLCKPNPYYVVPKSAPLLHEDVIYQGVDDGNFFAINSASGEIMWSYKIPFGTEGKRIFSSPTIYGDLVIFGAYDGNLYALNSLTGKKKWIFLDADAVGSSPALAEDTGIIYIGLEFGLFKKKGGIAAIDVDTGKSIWTYYEMNGLTHASPAYSKKMNVVICGCNSGKIYCFNATSGKINWTIEVKGEVKYGAIFDERRGLAYIGSLDGSVYAINVKKGEIEKIFLALAGIYSNPILYNNYLIVGSLDKNIYCWDTDTGKRVWVHTTNGRIFASGLIYENRLYMGSNDGRLRVLNPSDGELMGDILLAERIVNKIQAKDGIIYIPTQTCQLFAFKEIKLK